MVSTLNNPASFGISVSPDLFSFKVMTPILLCSHTTSETDACRMRIDVETSGY